MLKTIYKFLTLILLSGISLQLAKAQTAGGRSILNFDKNWKFLQADASGAENPSFNDTAWRTLDVPHDWSIEGSYDKAAPVGSGGGYMPSGIGWYRKTFTVDEKDSKRRFSIEFDGVMANSDVWINGVHLGKRPFGYISFVYDLTGKLNYGAGKQNVLAVRADNSVQTASRWYTGAGIYRHVRLVSTDQAHFGQWGVYVTTPKVSASKATVLIQAEVVNQGNTKGDYIIDASLVDATGKIVKTTQSKQSVAAGATANVTQTLEVASPKLWSTEQPNLYKAVLKIKQGKNTLDDYTTTVGIREARFDAATGFWLNGKNMKIKGVCLHHDGGSVGAAVPLRVWERRFEKLKEIGVNGIRTAHNPPAPEFLDLADRMGFLVMDESFDTWNSSKPGASRGYNLYFTEWWDEDTRDMVLRDRNHPSIVIYSVGNEIHDNLNDSTGFKKYADQQNLIHKLDPSRPVTMALFRPNVSGVYKNGFVEKMDITGQNYRENELVDIHNAKPQLKVIGTENSHGLAAWLALRDNPFMSGQFLWAGIDYLGEAIWPNISYNQGLMDRTGTLKHFGLQRQSWWSEKPVVHVLRNNSDTGTGALVANWTPDDFGTYDVARLTVYSNCDEVELFINGKSIGAKPKPANDAPRTWETTFEKGTLKAVGKNGGKEVVTETHLTAGDPARIMLKVDKSKISNNWDDVSHITATIVDANGVICPNTTTDKLLTFTITGPGSILGLDNGDNQGHEKYKGTEHSTYRGLLTAVIGAKATGTINVKVSAPGLADGTATITVEK